MHVPDFANVTNVALAHAAISRIVLDNWKRQGTMALN